METKWLEDFLSVAETLNFSRSAKLRNVTQPAFCRRIRSLESWVGVELFDRATFPARLTPAGQVFLIHARDMLKHTHAVRTLLRDQTPGGRTMLRVAMSHTLSITCFPRWLDEVEQAIGRLPIRIEACNTYDAIRQMVDGNCDLLMCYQHPQQSLDLDPERHESMVIATEMIRPYAKAGADGRALHRLPGSAEAPLPFLAYSSNTGLGRIVERTLEEDPCQAYLYRRFEGDLAAGLLSMALHGYGIAWLPQAMVEQDLAEGRLALAVEPGHEQGLAWSAQVDVRLYRNREAGNPEVDALWKHLVAIHGAPPKL